jgi:hypothetical protein
VSDPDAYESPYAASLQALGPAALHRLWRLLQDDAGEDRNRVMRALIRVPPTEGARLLGQLVATCDADRAARLEILGASAMP